MSSDRPKKLFKVASEFNVSTQTIVDSLSERGYTVANRPNSNVTGEMVAVLEEIYGVDKAKNLEHDRHREEYEHRRSYLGGGRADSLKPDQSADFGPGGDLKPLDEPGLEPLEEPGLAPLDEPGLEPLEEPGLEPLEEPGLAPLDEPGLEPLEEPALEADGGLESAPEPVADEPEPAPQESPVQEPVAAAETPEAAESPEQQTPPPADQVEPDQAPSVAAAPEEGESEAEETESAPEDATVSSEEPEAEVQAPEASGAGAESIVRAKADRLKGTKILGKVKINRDDFAGTGVRPAAKRKRKKDLLPGESAVKTPAATATAASSADKKRKKGKKGKTDSVQVGRSVRETMQQIQLGASVTGKRAKRRRQRREERMEEAELAQLEQQIGEGTIEVSEYVTVSDLAQLLDVKPNDVIMTCMSIGSMVSINQRLDANIIELVASEYGRDVHFVDAEELTDEQLTEEEDAPEDLETRAPIITVMGHVDHGKTSLLDHIRKSKVAAGEAGGITQHVGAYEVTTRDGRRITFLDTPGHEAFTAMRSRGAQATDIVILVVAADDSVMPQTIEAINHAKAAEVPVVVAINKIDKDGANPDKIKQQLSEHGVIVEEWGGETQCANVSAKSGQGIDELLDKVLIESELLDLKANPNRRASGIVLESRIDKGKGIVSNVLVQRGTLKIGDPFVAGPCYGRVRAMEDERGQRITEAGPSVPVQLTGFDDIPQAGDRMLVLKDEKTAKEIASQRQQIKREQTLRKTKHLTLDDLSRRMALGELSELNLILKADVDGSIEALSGSLQKLSTDEVAVNIIHTGSGAITESDVLLASASDAIIIGFQVRPTTSARKLAESESIDIRLFSVIYDAIDEVRDALEGMLQPEIKEQIRGTADVREVFRITKVGTIAGCYVIDGKIERPNPVRIIRDGIVIFNGQIDSLKRFKDDVKEVATGYECGISIQNFNDLKVGDQIESYMVTEEKRKLEEVR